MGAEEEEAGRVKKGTAGSGQGQKGERRKPRREEERRGRRGEEQVGMGVRKAVGRSRDGRLQRGIGSPATGQGGAAHRGRRRGLSQRGAPEDTRTRRSRRCWCRCRPGKGPPRCTRPRLRDRASETRAHLPLRLALRAAPLPRLYPTLRMPRPQDARRPRPKIQTPHPALLLVSPPPAMSPALPHPGPARGLTEARCSAGSRPVAGGTSAGEGPVGVEALAVGEAEVALQTLVNV